MGAFDVSEKTNYDDFSSSLRKQRNTRSIDSVDVPSQKTPWSDLTSRGGLHWSNFSSEPCQNRRIAYITTYGAFSFKIWGVPLIFSGDPPQPRRINPSPSLKSHCLVGGMIFTARLNEIAISYISWSKGGTMQINQYHSTDRKSTPSSWKLENKDDLESQDNDLEMLPWVNVLTQSSKHEKLFLKVKVSFELQNDTVFLCRILRVSWRVPSFCLPSTPH